MVKHHSIQQTEEMVKISTNDGDEIQSLLDKIKQQSKYSQTLIKIRKSYQWDYIIVETTKNTSGQTHKPVGRVNWITLQCSSKQLPSKLKNRSPKAQQRT